MNAVIINLDFVQTLETSATSINNLILGKEQLEMIRALSRRQSRRHDAWSADFIEGKGTGTIILLHG